MSNARPTIAGVAFAGGLLVAQPVFATHHLWDFSEAFSNADGSIQFIELTTTFDGQQFIQGAQISSFANGVMTATFIFPTNVPPNTANRSLLLATPEFVALKGTPVPDFIIPAQFFHLDTTSITLVYSSGFDSWTFSSNSMPTDCVDSLHRSVPGGTVTVGPASPTNFAGHTNRGELCVCPADINGSGAVDVSDLLAVINGWGDCPAPRGESCPADINNDNNVNVTDLLAVINAWGACS